MNQKQTLKTLILLSVGLREQQKQELIQKIESISSLQVKELILLFEAEQSIKDTLLRKKFKKNPELAEQYMQELQKISSDTRSNAEHEEKNKNDTSRMQGLLNQLKEL